MKEDLLAVIIPIYKETLGQYEVLSLKQCLKVLNKYKIVFVAPENVNFNYIAFCKDVNYEIIKFENSFFESIEGYNRLMLSTEFYKRLLNYKFILIHQLDAFVFKDELIYWCSKNYDFIGAPITPHKNLPNELQFLKTYAKFLSVFNKIFRVNHQISNVGNGGLSLRKTKSCYWLLKLLGSAVKKWGKKNEDGFFRYWGNKLHPFFRLPADEIALRFSIETEPEKSLKKLNYNLPFGCHAYEKYEWDTWKPYILKKKCE